MTGIPHLLKITRHALSKYRGSE